VSKISRTQHCSGLSYALCVHLQNGNCELNCFIFSNLLKLSPFFDWSMYNLVNQICDGSARCICELFRIRRLAAIGNVLVITKKKKKYKNCERQCKLSLVKTLMNVARISTACGCHRIATTIWNCDYIFVCARQYTGNIKLKLLYCVKAK